MTFHFCLVFGFSLKQLARSKGNSYTTLSSYAIMIGLSYHVAMKQININLKYYHQNNFSCCCCCSRSPLRLLFASAPVGSPEIPECCKARCRYKSEKKTSITVLPRSDTHRICHFTCQYMKVLPKVLVRQSPVRPVRPYCAE